MLLASFTASTTTTTAAATTITTNEATTTTTAAAEVAAAQPAFEERLRSIQKAKSSCLDKERVDQGSSDFVKFMIK